MDELLLGLNQARLLLVQLLLRLADLFFVEIDLLLLLCRLHKSVRRLISL